MRAFLLLFLSSFSISVFSQTDQTTSSKENKSTSNIEPDSAISKGKVSLYFAQTYSTFNYQNSSIEKHSPIRPDIRYSYGINFSKEYATGLFLRPELGYKNLGANSILNNLKLDWSLHYLDLGFGGGYKLNTYKVKPYLGTSFYYAYLYKASQGIGQNYFNLIEEGVLKRNDFGIFPFIGFEHKLVEYLFISFETRYAWGLKQLEVNEGEKLFNRALSFHFSLSFSITNMSNNEK